MEKLGHTVIHGVGWTSNRPITMMANSDHKSTFEVQEEDSDCAVVIEKLSQPLPDNPRLVLK